MILPDLQLPSRANQRLEYTGLDSIDKSPDPDYFQNYAWPIAYEFNNRGFRDSEWPDSLEDLQQSIWCIGDSFTVGIGVPYQHTWFCRLGQATGRRTINVSMDGASNNWIARRARQILDVVQPAHMVIHWSFLHRRETHDVGLLDEQRRLYNVKSSAQEDIDNLAQCISSLGTHANIVHSFIPEFAPAADIDRAVRLVQHLPHVPYFVAQDRGRDSLHYDCVTSDYFVQQIVPLLM
jgi:hypothetical protein